MTRKTIIPHRLTVLFGTAVVVAALAAGPALAQETAGGPVDATAGGPVDITAGGPVDITAGGPVDVTAAEQIALTDAGAEDTGVDRLHVKQEHEDREQVIEVDFTYEDCEYEYTIREEDGVILEWQVGGRNVTDAVTELSLSVDEDADESSVLTGDGVALIGLEAAKEAVLADFDAADEITFTSIHFENDGRYYEYEFELYAGRAEYEYTVDAESGEIVHSERDD